MDLQLATWVIIADDGSFVLYSYRDQHPIRGELP